MRLLVVVALGGLAIFSCNRQRAPVVHPVDPVRVAELVQVAQAEVQRGAGVDELLRLASGGDEVVRAAALRGLGRVGDARAIAELRSRLVGREAAVAAEAIGHAGLLGSLEEADLPAISAELAVVTGAARPAAITALGRAGDASGMVAIRIALGDADPAVAAAAGIAVGMLGRRGLAPDEPTILAAAARASDPDRSVRYAAIFGLGRGFVAPADGSAAAGADAAAKALASRIGDEDAEIRALALAGLARRKARAAAGDLATGALADKDWRVQVAAIRLTGGGGATAEDAGALAALCAREWTRLTGGDAPASTAHVLIEALRGLAASVGVTEVRQVLLAIATSSRDTLPAARPASVRLAANHVRALVHAALARVDDASFTPEQSLAIVEGVQLLDEVIGGLVAEALVARLDAHPADAAAALVARAGADQPPGRRAAVLAVMGEVYVKAAGAAVVDVVLAGIADDRPDVAGSAADAAVAILAYMATQPMLSAPYGLPQLHQALIDRLASATDPELLSSLLGAAGKAVGAAATEACTAAWTHANPAVRAAARECLKTITGADPGPGTAAAATRPPVDPASVIGKHVRWTVETTRGTVIVDLDGYAAPWHVAAIVHLSNKGFYDDLLFHRVVPDFVVQGGDPTGTGWGGPDFTLPSEPSALPYTRGAIGIADAGMDTGGSQWFIMHSRAPHLDGRYTVIGHIVDGERVIDQLLVGDRIVKATVAL